MRALCAAAAAAGRPTPLRRPGHWQRPAARPAPCRRAAVGVRAYQGDSSAEEAATGDKSAVDRSAAFNQLAKQLAGALASEFASNQGSVYEGLEKWLTGSHDESQELPPRSDQTTEESDAKKLMRQAAEVFGMPTNIPDAITSVQHWLSNPSHGEESADTQMAARLVHRLLEEYETQAGEEFEGHEHQYDRLYSLASRVLGSSVPKHMLKGLVRAYLGV